MILPTNSRFRQVFASKCRKIVEKITLRIIHLLRTYLKKVTYFVSEFVGHTWMVPLAEMVDEYPEISGITNAREAMKNMAEEDKAVIAEQVESFRTEKRMFDQEVSKWDDQGNDIIVLAKHMCMIMMEMTDFTRGKSKDQCVIFFKG